MPVVDDPAMPGERKALVLAFTCNFLLLGSYYILRPLRDTVATIIGVGHLQQLFTATFVGTVAASAVYSGIASRIRLRRLIPGVFWFWLGNLGVFAALFRFAPDAVWLNEAFYVWFSVVNLSMISVFWSLMAEVFRAEQATRLFASIAAGGALGAIAGPLVTRVLVASLGLSGMLLIAAVGFALIVPLVHLLMRGKALPGTQCGGAVPSTFDDALRGGAFDGFRSLMRSKYALTQAAFVLLMTWVNTVAYFCQTDLIARTFGAVTSRAQAIADIDIVVNVLTAAVLFGGSQRIVRRFGVTAGLVLNPLLMIVAFLLTALSPTLLMIQILQIVRRVAQYAIARPTREICFTVVPRTDRYKSKNVIDTVVYRLGDLSSAWLQAGFRSAGVGLTGTIAIGVVGSVVWAAAAGSLARRYEGIRRKTGFGTLPEIAAARARRLHSDAGQAALKP